MKKRKPHVWCIARINEYYPQIPEDLINMGFSEVKTFIPTVKILNKKTKGKNVYKEVPYLFHYGFFRIPLEKAYSRPYLNSIRRKVPGITSRLKGQESMHRKKKKARVDNPDDFDDFSIVAMVSTKEVRRIRRAAKNKNKQVFANDEIANLKIGDYVILRGYPFEGVDATILDLDLRNRMVKVEMYPQMGQMVMKLPLDNVVFSIYNDFNENKLWSSASEIDQNKIKSPSGYLDIEDI